MRGLVARVIQTPIDDSIGNGVVYAIGGGICAVVGASIVTGHVIRGRGFSAFKRDKLKAGIFVGSFTCAEIFNTLRNSDSYS